MSDIETKGSHAYVAANGNPFKILNWQQPHQFNALHDFITVDTELLRWKEEKTAKYLETCTQQTTGAVLYESLFKQF